MDNSNPLDQLIQLLMHAAQARPDLAQSQPLATFAGRVIQPGDDIHSAMSRLPMGNGPSATPGAATGAMASGMAPQMGYQGMRALMAALAPTFNPAQAVGGMAGGDEQPGQVSGYNDPWGIQRESAQRPQPSMATNMRDTKDMSLPRNPDGSLALPRNPRDIQFTPQQQAEYNKLPASGRTQQVPEDARRRMMGEVAGPSSAQPTTSGATPATDLYSLWQTLAKGLGIPTAEGQAQFRLPGQP